MIHTHSKAAVMVTLLYPGKEFKITHQEMIKGISRGQTGKKYCYHDELVIPIIENTPEERDLTVSAVLCTYMYHREIILFKIWSSSLVWQYTCMMHYVL